MSTLLLVVLVPAAVAFGVVPLLLYLWGRTLPATHEVREHLHVAAPRDKVYALLVDVRAIPRWRKTIRAVDVISAGVVRGADATQLCRPSEPGTPVEIESEPRVRFREHGAQGALVLEMEAQEAPSKIVLRVSPAHRMAFEGTWTYELDEQDDGTRVTLTERGTVRSPFARIFAAYVLGHSTHVQRTLAALAKRFRR